MAGLGIVGRGIALFLGVYACIGALAALVRPGLSLNRWWIDLRPLPRVPSEIFLCVAGSLFVAWAVSPCDSGWRLAATRAAVLALAAAALVNAAGFVLLVLRHRIAPGITVPLSLGVAAALLAVAASTSGPHAGGLRPLVASTGVAALCALAFPALQALHFGTTDYRRRADAIVVFGARAYADGSLSAPLAERMNTACELWHAGQAPTIIVSGGPGDGAVHETEAMRRYAESRGVPSTAILCDLHGVSTSATVRNTSRLLDAMNAHRVLAVSHAYHTPRVKLAFESTGLDVLTVPSPQDRPLARLPWSVAREAAAWWVYVGRSVAGL